MKYVKLNTILFGLLFLAGIANAENWKKNFCGNKTYVGQGGKYPHLHCDSKFLTYSKSGSDHINFAKGDNANCSQLNNAKDNLNNRGSNEVVDFDDIMAVLENISNDYKCN